MSDRLKAAVRRLTLAHVATLRVHVNDFTIDESELFAELPDILTDILIAEDADAREQLRPSGAVSEATAQDATKQES